MARTFNLLHRDGKKVFVECMPYFMDNRNVHFNFPRETNYDVDAIFAETRLSLIRMLKFIKSMAPMMERLGTSAMRTPPQKSVRKVVLSFPLIFMVEKVGPTRRPPPNLWAMAEDAVRQNNSKKKSVFLLLI